MIALTSARSCGVTTSALALMLAHTRPTLLAECDLAGGTIRNGLLQGRIGVETGLAHLAAADRQDLLAQAFEQHLRRLDDDGNRQLLPGLTDPRQASALAGSWSSLAQLLTLMDQQAGYDVLIDAGRIALDAGRVHPVLSPAPLLHRADLVLLVVRSDFVSLTAAQPVVAALRDDLATHGTGADALAVLLLESGAYRPHEAGTFLQAPVIAALPWDQATADYLSSGEKRPRSLGRTALLRSARTTVSTLDEWSQKRRVQLQFGTARAPSPVVQSVVQRLAQRGVPAGG